MESEARTVRQRAPWKRLLRVLIILVCVIGMGAIVVQGLFLLLSVGLCSERKVASFPSPDSHYVAMVFERNCGATTDYVMHVNLRDSSHAFRADISGVIKDGSVFVHEGYCRVDIRWRDSRTLMITAPQDDVFQKARKWKDVAIIYAHPRVSGSGSSH